MSKNQNQTATTVEAPAVEAAITATEPAFPASVYAYLAVGGEFFPKLVTVRKAREGARTFNFHPVDSHGTKVPVERRTIPSDVWASLLDISDHDARVATLNHFDADPLITKSAVGITADQYATMRASFGTREAMEAALSAGLVAVPCAQSKSAATKKATVSAAEKRSAALDALWSDATV